jgi:hypothetical protein
MVTLETLLHILEACGLELIDLRVKKKNQNLRDSIHLSSGQLHEPEKRID